MSNAYGCVVHAVRRSLHEGLVLTPPDILCGGDRGALFRVTRLDHDRLALSVGETGSPIYVRWHEFEGMLQYIRGFGGEVRIGSVQDSSASPGSLDGYLKQNHKTMRSTYVASILHQVGIAEVVCGRPMRIRLRHDWQ